MDDEPTIVQTEREILEDQGYEVLTATSAPSARKLLNENFFDLLILDERIQTSSGTELFAETRLRYPGIGAIFITGYADLNCAVRALRAGALDLLQKPIDKATLLSAVRRALEESALARESRLRWYDVRSRPDFPDIIGDSPALTRVLAQVQQVIPTDAAVLLDGESGTGKELVARAIHYRGARHKKPFVAVNAGAIPSSLMEATLFGHRKGAFTDAREDRPGLFEVAHGGTIFFDEIGEMAPDVQIRLLRVLQERTVTRVGDTVEIPIDVRVIAATNRNLKTEVAEGRFRKDLFFRLAVFPITLPPLRGRSSDIRALTMHLIEKHGRMLKKTIKSVSENTLRRLEEYAWPGNVRELDNVIQRAIIVTAKDTIEPEDVLLEPGLSADAGQALSHLTFGEAQIAFERQYFSELLQRYDGNISQAAKAAQIDRTSMHAHLKKIGWYEKT